MRSGSTLSYPLAPSLASFGARRIIDVALGARFTPQARETPAPPPRHQSARLEDHHNHRRGPPWTHLLFTAPMSSRGITFLIRPSSIQRTPSSGWRRPRCAEVTCTSSEAISRRSRRDGSSVTKPSASLSRLARLCGHSRWATRSSCRRSRRAGAARTAGPRASASAPGDVDGSWVTPSMERRRRRCESRLRTPRPIRSPRVSWTKSSSCSPTSSRPGSRSASSMGRSLPETSSP